MRTASSLVSHSPALVTGSIAEVRNLAMTSSRAGATGMAGQGEQDAVRVSDDLIIMRSDVHSLPPVRLEFDMQGWLILHLRIKGASIDRYPDGRELSHDDGCFIVTACTTSRSFVRELLTEDWRTVTIGCSPSFLEREMRGDAADLPEPVQQFRAGAAGIDFVHAGALTSSMRAGAEALLHTALPSGLRPTYMHAKALELLCLAFQCVHEAATAEPAIRLSRRDAECLHKARSLLTALSRAPSLDELARQVGINRRKLALGFKQIFGMTVGEFDRAQRLERARDLLEQGVHTIGHVAWLAGYADQGSFSKAYKARYGELPRESRVA